MLAYSDSSGAPRRYYCRDALDHVFNHQTHHRGQVHALLSSFLGNDATQSLDLLIYQRQTGQGGIRKAE